CVRFNYNSLDVW
nr:immunoglobulin heavy chain junction region [Macaca mulatta]